MSKVKVIFGITVSLLSILSILSIYLVFYYYGNKDNSKKSSNNLSTVRDQLYKSISSLTSHSACQDDASNQLIKDINDLKQKGNDIINNSSDSPSPESKDLFNKALVNVDDIINKISMLPSCNVLFCPQGTYTTDKGCVCPDKYPYPILGDDKKTTYCYDMPCSNINNGKFVPYNSSDPSNNSCLCDDGYAHDKSRPTDASCYNINDTNNLTSYANQINNDITSLNQYLNASQSIYGSWQNSDKTIKISINENGSAIISAGSAIRRTTSIGVYDPTNGKICIDTPACNNFAFFNLDPNNAYIAIYDKNGTKISFNRV